MTQINTNIDDKILSEFRHIVYTRYGLRRGDITKSLEEVMLDYISNHTKSVTMKELGKSSGYDALRSLSHI